MKFRLDNPKYLDFNNLFEISLNGALNSGVFKILIHSKWPWNPNFSPGPAIWAAKRPRKLVPARNLGFMAIWNKSISWTPPPLRAPFRDISNKLLKLKYFGLSKVNFIKTSIPLKIILLSSDDPSDRRPQTDPDRTGPDRTGLEHPGLRYHRRIIISSCHYVLMSWYHHIIISPWRHIIISSYHHVIISSFSKKTVSQFWAKSQPKNRNSSLNPLTKERNDLKFGTSGVIFRGESAGNAQKFVAPPKRTLSDLMLHFRSENFTKKNFRASNIQMSGIIWNAFCQSFRPNGAMFEG